MIASEKANTHLKAKSVVMYTYLYTKNASLLNGLVSWLYQNEYPLHSVSLKTLSAHVGVSSVVDRAAQALG